MYAVPTEDWFYGTSSRQLFFHCALRNLGVRGATTVCSDLHSLSRPILAALALSLAGVLPALPAYQKSDLEPGLSLPWNCPLASTPICWETIISLSSLESLPVTVAPGTLSVAWSVSAKQRKWDMHWCLMHKEHLIWEKLFFLYHEHEHLTNKGQDRRKT